MVKVLALLKRKQGMTLEEFNDYWEHVHAELVVATTEFVGGCRRYLLSQVIPGGLDSSLPVADYDGCAELWFDDVETVNEAYLHERTKEVLFPDLPKFADVLHLMVVREVPIIGSVEA